jgi:hypothetical protein
MSTLRPETSISLDDLVIARHRHSLQIRAALSA